jgi:hypothetical protein
MNKYRNRKTVVNGITFDSKKEAKRYQELLLLERTGAIQSLERQKKYILIPAQREWSSEVYVKGKKKGQPKQGKLLERECSYIADFVYQENGQTIVEDTKGVRTKDYRIKRKLMLYVYGIRIREI